MFSKYVLISLLHSEEKYSEKEWDNVKSSTETKKKSKIDIH